MKKFLILLFLSVGLSQTTFTDEEIINLENDFIYLENILEFLIWLLMKFVRDRLHQKPKRWKDILPLYYVLSVLYCLYTCCHTNKKWMDRHYDLLCMIDLYTLDNIFSDTKNVCYIIVSPDTKKWYLGETERCMNDRLCEHINNAFNKNKHEIKLYDFMNNHGVEKFVFIPFISIQSNIKEYEGMLINKFRPSLNMKINNNFAFLSRYIFRDNRKNSRQRKNLLFLDMKKRKNSYTNINSVRIDEISSFSYKQDNSNPTHNVYSCIKILRENETEIIDLYLNNFTTNLNSKNMLKKMYGNSIVFSFEMKKDDTIYFYDGKVCGIKNFDDTYDLRKNSISKTKIGSLSYK